MSNRPYLLFLGISVVQLVSILLGWNEIAFWSKCFLIPSLIVGVFNTLQRKEPAFYTVLSALCFSTLGDVLLLFDSKSALFFFAGLGSFLIAQIFYIITFFRMSNKPYPSRVGWLYLFVFVILLAILYPGMPMSMKIPVTAYGFCLTMMSLNSWRMYSMDHSVGLLIGVGSILFMVSDSVLAIGKFKWELPYGHFIVMVTYILAQYLLASGLVRMVNSKS